MIGTTITHYQITAKLGQGGMGEVYRATDTKLDREVAIKILPPEIADSPQRRKRFLREAKAAAALNHPHVCTIYEVGETEGGQPFIAMEYLPGQTLESFAKQKPLENEALVDLAIQIADALDAAHQAGVVHRDIKPANIHVDAQSRIKVLDFGLAKRTDTKVAGDTGATTEEQTEPGKVMGTPCYMSPEQARGEALDHRSDLFSLGIVLYQLTTSRLPFKGSSFAETVEKITRAQPEAIARFNYDISSELERIIRKCLEKKPEERYQSARELLIDFKRLRRDTDSGQSPIAATASEAMNLVAVLPFVNASGDPSREYLSDGITESLINSLSQLPNLKVKSRDSSFRYKGKDTDSQTIGRELGVRAIFKGRIIQLGDTLAISAELIDTRNDTHLWGEQYSRKASDIFALQRELATEMTIALRLRLTGEEAKRVAKSYTANPEAYQDYLRGRFWSNKSTEEGFQKGVDHFHLAIAKDPAYALAYVGLALCQKNFALIGMVDPREPLSSAREAALKALELDDTIPEAHAVLGRIKAVYDWDWSGGEKELERAIVLDPNDGNTRLQYALVLKGMGQLENAIAESQRALELDPLSMLANLNLSHTFYITRQYEEAISRGQKVLELDPNFIPGHAMLCLSYLQQSKYEQGIAEIGKAVAAFPNDTGAQLMRGYAFAATGRNAEARSVLEKVDGLSKQRYAPPTFRAMIYLALGEKDKAFEWLEKAYEDRSILTVGPFSSVLAPAYDPLRSDPRFADLLRRMNLQP